MPGLPEITAIGTLTADPELRATSSGAMVVNFTVASNDRRFDKDRNEWVDGDACFLRCNLWRQPAENVAESLRKGHRVIVTGQLKQREWQTKEGEKRTAYELEVSEVGPSLKWATASVTKASRNGDDRSTQHSRPASTVPASSSWGNSDDSQPPF
jgi:single-strand DNA-binding protein